MKKLKKDNNGYVLLKKMNRLGIIPRRFIYNKECIFCKPSTDACLFNEMIVEMLAKDYEINVAETFIGIYKTSTYILSKSVYNPYLEDMFTLKELTNNSYHFFNDFESIEILLMEKFPHDYQILMEELKEIFLFDVLIGNSDRNYKNLAVVVNKISKEVHFAPLYDNEFMLDKVTIAIGRYGLGINKDSFQSNTNFLESFLLENEKYIDYLLSKLWIIEKVNILKIFERVESEKKIELSKFDKEEYLRLFEINRKMILSIIERVKKEKMLEFKEIV